MKVSLLVVSLSNQPPLPPYQPQAVGAGARSQDSFNPKVIRVRSSSRYRRNLLLDLPIAGRLTLGFLTAALIAALAAGIVGIQRSQALSRQSDFYQNLLQTNTTLTTGASFLQLMDTKTHETLTTAGASDASKETLAADQSAVQNLATRYGTVLQDYVSHDLLAQHADQIALLTEADHQGQVGQQQTLAGSTLRTWYFYRLAQQQVLQDIATGNIAQAQYLERFQAEPTNADALSAMRALIQFDERLASSVQDAAGVEEQNQLIATIIGSVLAFICIALVGLLISNTLIKRLKQLRHVTQAVEQGHLNTRVSVIGRDEIADVSASVNAMLETIVGLLEETRNQRDALTNAAAHLFSDIRVVSAGDLRVQAAVSNDPIGMLANAFNFTVSRFRRFVLRTQMAVEQIDVISRQELEHSEAFGQLVNDYLQEAVDETPTTSTPSVGPAQRTASGELFNTQSAVDSDKNMLMLQVHSARKHLKQLSGAGIAESMRALQPLMAQASTSMGRLNRSVGAQADTRVRQTANGENIAQAHLQELRTLGIVLARISSELQKIEKYTGQGFFELDTDLSRITTSIRELNTKPTTSTTPEEVKEAMQELARPGAEFSSEVTVLARHLAALAKELRTGIISFQLDAADSSGGRLTSGQEASYKKPAAGYRLP